MISVCSPGFSSTSARKAAASGSSRPISGCSAGAGTRPLSRDRGFNSWLPMIANAVPLSTMRRRLRNDHVNRSSPCCVRIAFLPWDTSNRTQPRLRLEPRRHLISESSCERMARCRFYLIRRWINAGESARAAAVPLPEPAPAEIADAGDGGQRSHPRTRNRR